MASANRALSIFDLKPELEAMAFSSSALKMPLRRPVPMNPPMVSKVSEMLKEKIVISTRGSFVISWKREGSPWEVKITPKEDIGIYDDNIGHSKEGGYTGHSFG